ncbi:MAG: hypothetical protein H6705_12665 [Myxococcales bacterium]|nr:hypothetical protein [Myxococcales bacterium]
MQPGSIDRARRGLALAEARIQSAAAELARSPSPAGTSADRGDVVRLSARPADAEPVGAVLSLGEGARLYRANLQVVAAADEQLAHTLDLFA